MNSPFHTLTPEQQVADVLTECTHIMISLEQLASDPAQTATLVDLFQNAADEFTYGLKIGSLGLVTATSALEGVTNRAKSMKDTWEDEALAAEALSTAAAAAQIAAAVFSWAPGVNLCIDGGAIAACAAATTLEIISNSAENDVIKYISNFNNEVLAEPGMSDLQNWNSAIQKNVLNFKKLSLGATDQQIQATLMAITNHLVENKKDLTAANYGDVIYEVASTIANNPGIDRAWRNAMVTISKNPNPTDDDITKQAELISAQFPQVGQIGTGILNFFTVVMTIKDWQRWNTIRKLIKWHPLLEWSTAGDPAAAREWANADTDVVRLSKWANRLRVGGILVNAAVAVMSVFAIIDTVNAASQMSDAITKAHDGMEKFLTELVKSESAHQAVESS